MCLVQTLRIGIFVKKTNMLCLSWLVHCAATCLAELHSSCSIGSAKYVFSANISHVIVVLDLVLTGGAPIIGR